MAGSERDAESEPKPFGKGAEDGDLGASTRAGRIRVLEELIDDLEASIRPTLERMRALRGVIEQVLGRAPGAAGAREDADGRAPFQARAAVGARRGGTRQPVGGVSFS
jgi:hypothetical protein